MRIDYMPKFRNVTYPGVKEDFYIVNDQGIVLNKITGRILRYCVDKDGYFKVAVVFANGAHRSAFVHRLVAWEFCDHSDPDKTQVNHINGIKVFNFASNLEWVTPGENTRHAEQAGLRNIRGDSNGNSKYSEEFVRDICQMYEDGYQPMDVFHKFYPNQPIKTNGVDSENFYRFIRNLKNKTAWPSVVCDYRYDTQIKKDPSIKVFLPGNQSDYTADDVRWICQKIQDGYTPTEIYKIAKGDDGCTNVANMPKRKCIDTIGKIRRGQMWKHITKEFDFSKVQLNSHRTSAQYYDKIKDLENAGITKPIEIARVIGEEWGVSVETVLKYVFTYRKANRLIEMTNNDPGV